MGIRVLVPQRLRKRVVEMVHEGHVGIVRMKMIARGYVWWQGIDWELEELAKILPSRPGSAESPSGGTTTSVDLASQTLVSSSHWFVLGTHVFDHSGCPLKVARGGSDENH